MTRGHTHLETVTVLAIIGVLAVLGAHTYGQLLDQVEADVVQLEQPRPGADPEQVPGQVCIGP